MENESTVTDVAETRSCSDILNIVRCAKLDDNDMSSLCQSLEFASDLESDRIRLLELDKDMLEYLQSGNRLVIRGQDSDAAVMCTEDKTYDVRVGQTSNTMLLLPELTFPSRSNNPPSQHQQTISQLEIRKVHGVLHDFIELRPCSGRVQRLQQLLQEAPYSGKEYEADLQGRKYTLPDLLELVQASEVEIIEALKQLHACHIGGYYRILSQEYASQVLSSIVNFIEENSWTCDSIRVKETLDTLQDLHPRDILYHCLQVYGHPNNAASGAACSDEPPDSESTEVDEADLVYSLDETSVCRFYAKELLMFVGKFNYHEFINTWRQTVPRGMNTSMEQIRDLCLVDEESHPPTISYFPLHQLPEGAADRFNFLFKTRERWSREQIEPFIKDLCQGKMDVNALLTKFARCTLQKPGGVKVYNSRRPVR